MDTGYPLARPVYRMEYPPVDTTPAANTSKVEAPTANQGGQIINQRYKYYGYALLLMAFAILGLEIGNVAFTYNTFKPGTTTFVKKAFAAPYILTWIAPGIWGAIPILITGYLAVRVAGKINKLVRIFALFCSLSATVFTPAIISVSVAEIMMYSNNIPAGDTQPPFGTINKCYQFSSAASLSCPKFILPLIVAVLGGVAFYLTMMVTIIFCCCWDQKDVDGAPADTTETTQVIDEYYPYARNPPNYPPMARPPPPQPYPEPIYRAAPRMVQPNMDFLSAYPAYRPATSRGFGFAPAYNRQSYGGFPGTLPSLTNFGGGDQLPNPAYRVVYA